MFKKPLRHKYGAVSVKDDGKHFSSKLEWNYFKVLKMRQAAGDIIFFLRQVPFDLPGGIKYFVDFEIFLSDGSVEFVDCKGMKTPVSDIKIKQVQELYPVEIKIVTKV